MGRAMLSESLIQFSIAGWGCVSSLLFDLRPSCGRGSKIVGTSFQRSCARTAVFSAPDPAAATVDPCLRWRLLDTPRQVWLSLLRGHCFFLLGPGAYKVLFVPSKILFPQSCGISVVKCQWPPESNSLGVLSLFAGSPGWEICCGS